MSEVADSLLAIPAADTAPSRAAEKRSYNRDEFANENMNCMIRLESPCGSLVVDLDPWGASIREVHIRESDGTMVGITLGCDGDEDFRRNPFCLGATCGRFANRIGGARFELDGRIHQLARNDGENSLHGGSAPFHAREWCLKSHQADGESPTAVFSLTSPDGDGGYPGELRVSAVYQIRDGVLSVEYTASTDAPTILNLTNHVYWNLSGDPKRTIHEHRLAIPALRWLPIDDGHLVTGELRSVEGTAFDFRVAEMLGKRLALEDPQIAPKRGFNHSWRVDGDGLRVVAVLDHPPSGRRLVMRGNQPAVHVYTGGFLGDAFPGRGGLPIQPFGGIALESGGLPDAPNHPEFPSCVLRPGEIYQHRIEWEIGTV